MHRIRHLLPALLATIFWIAQVQGTVHGIGHLSSAAAAPDHLNAPHALHCDECASLAQAGAAPLLAFAATALAPTQGETVASAASSPLVATPVTFYRSRAPPLSPV